MLRLIDEFLNKITMYRLMLYYLIFLIFSAGFFALFGFLPYTFTDLLFSAIITLTAGYISNNLFHKIFKAETNVESVFITSLILVLIMPASFPKDSLLLVLSSFVAMASKYLFAFKNRHIFNPAAFSAVFMSLVFGFPANWWIGALVTFPLITIGGLLVLRKTQKEKPAAVFVSTFLLVTGIGAFLTTKSLETMILTWRLSIFESLLPFFIFVMLIEPLTSPTRKILQLYYAFVVSIFYTLPQVGIIALPISPEASLCIGNIFAYFINPNYRLTLSLKNKIKLSKDTYSFIFGKQKGFNFMPGQYMEWTLPHKNADSRGNRRYFSISSSPTEDEIMLTVKIYDNPSSYKKQLLNLKKGERIIASSLAGDFTLPKNLKTPLVFIAGGVGITPFRSMIQYIIDKKLQTNIILFFTNKTKEDIVFSDIFEKAKQFGVKTIYNLTETTKIPLGWKGRRGYITKQTIKETIPSFKNRIYFLSGPFFMVKNFEKTLIEAGISKNKIKTDFFPGYEEK